MEYQVGGNFITDFFGSLWSKFGFGKKVDGFLSSNNFNPDDLINMKGVLSKEIMADFKDVIGTNLSKKGSVANKFIGSLIDADGSINESDKAKMKKAFLYFVGNQRDMTTAAARSSLEKEYAKNISLVE